MTRIEAIRFSLEVLRSDVGATTPEHQEECEQAIEVLEKMLDSLERAKHHAYKKYRTW